MSKQLSSQQLADMVQGALRGQGDIAVSGVASLSAAAADKASFLANMKYQAQVEKTKAGVVFVPADYAGPQPAGCAFVVCKDPSAAFQKAVDFFAPPAVQYPAGIHASAVVMEGAVVPASCHVGPCAVISARAVLGERTVVGAGSFVGEEARIGADTLIYPNVTLRERCTVGSRCIIHSGTVVGSDGFGFIPGPAGHIKIPQVGIVEIQDDVELGANVAVDRARFGKTVVGRGTKVDNLVQIAHNVEIGQLCFIVAQVGIAGSATIGNGVILAGQAGLSGHIHVGDRAIVMPQAGVTGDVAPGTAIVGGPAIERKEFARQQMYIHALPQMKDNLKKLLAEVETLKAELAALKAK